MKRSIVPSLLLLLTLCSQTALAQGAAGGWVEVQRIKVDSKLTVRTKTGQKVEGRVKAVTPDSITLSLSKGATKEIEIKRDEVAEIRRKSAARTATYAALFGGLGVAAGYGIGYGVGEAAHAGYATEYPGAVIGAAVGIAVGAILGSTGQVIYKAP